MRRILNRTPVVAIRRRRVRLLAALVVAVPVVASLGRTSLAQSRPLPVYPGASWAALTPAEVGIDAAKLHAAIARSAANIGGVIRYGYMAIAWGRQERLSAGGSEIKPLFAHLLIEAVEAGKLADIDEFAGDYEPGLNSLNSALGYKDRKMRFRHMANQMSFFRDIQAAVVDPGPANALPTVDAGLDQTVTLPATAALLGTVSDDGLPGPLFTLWHFINGPGHVSFADPNAVRTTTVFSEAGRYLLRLTATDGSRISGDVVVVEVDPSMPKQGPGSTAFFRDESRSATTGTSTTRTTGQPSHSALPCSMPISC